ncbi:DUF7718 family protein [Candidatus Deferrimicrobium sp.]|uniref:DUF7718 family protein n=1 Tax=Candidatus Deferrimicrobium sp. TaxID=3060586 RepID=UPI003BB9407F
MPRQVQYIRRLSENVWKRHAHETDRGKVLGFTVQLEVWHDAKWNPIVRYDGSHGFPHKDVFRRNGELRKVPLQMSFKDALVFADQDIGESWEIYLQRFVQGDWP